MLKNEAVTRLTNSTVSHPTKPHSLSLSQ